MHAIRPDGRVLLAFERRVRLPEGLDGVLSLIVPKPERLQPEPIPVGTEQRELEASTA